MKWLVYALFRTVVWFLSSVSEKTLYRISFGIKFLLLNIVRYRLKVVQTNLTNSFPFKSKEEIQQLINQYYQNLSDILVESIASYGWPESRLKNHFVFKNLDVLNQVISQYSKVIAVSAHTGNFELGAALLLPLLGVPCFGIYRPLANSYIEKFTLSKRTQLGLIIKPNKQLNELLQQMTGAGLLFLVADQNPSAIQKACWVDFLNQDTAFVHGPAMLAKQHNMPILYFDIVRIRQGYYECYISILVTDPRAYTELELTKRYAAKLASSILAHPDDWLWSHKRWKWKRVGEEIVRI